MLTLFKKTIKLPNSNRGFGNLLVTSWIYILLLDNLTGKFMQYATEAKGNLEIFF